MRLDVQGLDVSMLQRARKLRVQRAGRAVRHRTGLFRWEVFLSSATGLLNCLHENQSPCQHNTIL